MSGLLTDIALAPMGAFGALTAGFGNGPREALPRVCARDEADNQIAIMRLILLTNSQGFV